jgi:hypothetical protein
MFAKLLTLLSAALSIGGAQAQNGFTWSTAVQKNSEAGGVVILRYLSTFPNDFVRHLKPIHISVLWKYKSESGMPESSERKQMDELEDLLELHLERSGDAILTIVSTGRNERELTYYAKSGDEFVDKLNVALAGKAMFPIEIRMAADKEWKVFDDFVRSARR